ncbi:hypothetical protein BKA66DRAFT_411571 [Pyrenochaeta sp. MPI-SDFR-AT-0127]|nr:hypothetical protein BKA66DRAFT_411571 [Pyrenochaeta sp. MPI-SDFR-AT-0127]
MSLPVLPTSRRFVTELLNSLPSVSLYNDSTAKESNLLSAVPEGAKKQLLSLQVLFPNEFVPALDLLDRRLVSRFRICNGQQLSASLSKSKLGATQHANKQTHVGDAAQSDDGQLESNPEALTALIDNTTHHRNLSMSASKASNVPAQDQTMADAPDTEETNQAQQDIHDEHSTIFYVRSAQQRSSRYSTSFDTTTSYEVRLQAWNCSCPAFAFAAFPAVLPDPPIQGYESPNEDKITSGQAVDNAEDGAWIFGGISLDKGMPPVCKHLLACVLAERCSGLFGAFVEDKYVSVDEAAGWAAGWGD